MKNQLTIGAVAARARLTTSAIRYYERVGLLRPPGRTGGKRLYDESVFEHLALIQLSQDAGFTLGEIRALLFGFADSAPPSERWGVLASRKRNEIAARIRRARQMQAVLDRLLQCRCETLGACVASRLEAMSTAVEKRR